MFNQCPVFAETPVMDRYVMTSLCYVASLTVEHRCFYDDMQLVSTSKGKALFSVNIHGNLRQQLTIFREIFTAPPIESDLGYRVRRRTVNPNPDPDPNPNPRTHPKPNPIFNRNQNKVFERKKTQKNDTEI